MDGKAEERPHFEGSSLIFLHYEDIKIQKERIETFFNGGLPTRENTQCLIRKTRGQECFVYFPENYKPNVKPVFLNIRDPETAGSMRSYDAAFDEGIAAAAENGKDGVVVDHEDIGFFGDKAFDAVGFSMAVSSTDQVLCLREPHLMKQTLQERRSRRKADMMQSNFATANVHDSFHIKPIIS
jgi:hypothetical protein